MTLERSFNIFDRFENQAVQPLSKRGKISTLRIGLRKGGVKKRFCLCRNFRRESSIVINHLPPYFMGVYSLSTSEFWCNPPYIVDNFS